MEIAIDNKNKESNNLNICHQNIMSVGKKRVEFSLLMQSNLIRRLSFL